MPRSPVKISWVRPYSVVKGMIAFFTITLHLSLDIGACEAYLPTGHFSDSIDTFDTTCSGVDKYGLCFIDQLR